MKLTPATVWHKSSRNGPSFHSSIIVLFLALTPNVVFGQAMLKLKNGLEISATITNVTPNAVNWRNYPSGGGFNTTPLDQVSSIDFPPTEEWEVAEREMSLGNYLEAGRLFSTIASQKQENQYPAPGNYASLALKRILQCHRRLLNAEQVAAVAKRIQAELNTLPPGERRYAPQEQAWIAAGNEDWERVIQIAGESRDVELSYLRGLAHRSSGNDGEALDGFTTAATLGFSSHRRIAEAALRSAAELLVAINDESRQSELQAQLKIYQELYGAGKLWEGTPDSFVELARVDFKSMVPESDSFFPDAEEPAGNPAKSKPPSDEKEPPKMAESKVEEPASPPPSPLITPDGITSGEDWILATATDPIAY